MNRILRRFLLFFALAFLVALVRFPYDSLSMRLVSYLKEQALEKGASLQIDKFQMHSPRRATFERLGLMMPVKGWPFSLNFTNGVLSLRALPLIIFRLTLSGKAQAYEGSVEGSLSTSLFGEKMALESVFRGLDLESYPALEFYGVSGELEGTFRAKGTKRIFPEESTLSLTLHDASLALQRITGSFLKISKLSDVNLALQVKQEQRNLKLEKVELTSSLGTASGKGGMGLDSGGQIEQCDLKIHIFLNELGEKELSPYFGALAGGNTKGASSQWQMSIVKEKATPLRIIVTPAIE